MALQLCHPIPQPLYIPHQHTHFLADQVGLLAHAGILHHRLDGVDRQHQDMLGDTTITLARWAFWISSSEIGMHVGINRFRRHEHDGRGLDLAGDQIFRPQCR